MKKNISILILFLALLSAAFINRGQTGQAALAFSAVQGRILLQVEQNGEAWYVYPYDGERYFLGRPEQAFDIMRRLSLGAKHDFIVNTKIFPARLSGIILLDVEANGEAYYIYPGDLKKYYLGRPADAFNLMRSLGLGITDKNLAAVPTGDINKAIANLAADPILINNVPFTAQAPTGDWADPRQQNGCEEAAALMAVSWARGQSFTTSQALKQITAISDFELNKYGQFHDASARDTLDWIIKDYFGYQNAELIKNAVPEDIINQLRQGHIIIAPMDGQLMGNPNFTGSGPTTHMVVVIGYDPTKRVFITNDPGTRRGQNYQYDINVFYSALRDYPTGYHEPIARVEKNIIAVKKQ